MVLVLNPRTGYVSPQYHIVIDDAFSTVSNLRSGTVPANWSKLVEESAYLSTDEDYDLSKMWLREVSSTADEDSTMIDVQANAGAIDIVSDGTPITHCEGAQDTQATASEGDAVSKAASKSVSFDDPTFTQVYEGDDIAVGPHMQPEYINLASAGLCRTSRICNIHKGS